MNPANAQTLSGLDHVTATLLLSESDFDVRLGAKSLFRSDSSRADALDLAGEIAWSACSGNREMNPDTLAWLAKALGNSKQPRFATLLDYCLSRPINEKTKKHVKLAREQLRDAATADSFEGGRGDLQQMRARLIRDTRTISPDAIAAKTSDIRSGQTIEQIYSLLGYPSTVAGENVPQGKAGHLFVKVRISADMILLEYPGLGSLRFVFDQDRKDWTLLDARSAGDLYWSGHEGRFATLKEVVAQGGGMELRAAAKRLIGQDRIDQDMLDTVAARLYESRAEHGDNLGDGLAWLCKVLQKNGDGKYKQLLLDVSEAAQDKTLRKYAALAAAALPEPAEAAYVPASQPTR